MTYQGFICFQFLYVQWSLGVWPDEVYIWFLVVVCCLFPDPMSFLLVLHTRLCVLTEVMMKTNGGRNGCRSLLILGFVSEMILISGIGHNCDCTIECCHSKHGLADTARNMELSQIRSVRFFAHFQILCLKLHLTPVIVSPCRFY